MKKIYIEITNICNLSCSFCPKNKREKRFMKVSEFEVILEKIKDYTKYINLYVMGEPLMHPNLKDILDCAHEHGFQVNLTTNGRLLEGQFETIFESKAIRQVNISLHSFEKLEEQKKIVDLIDKMNKDQYISLRLWTSNENKEIIHYIEATYQIKVEKQNQKIKENLYLNQDMTFEWPTMDRDIISEVGTCYGLRDHIGILVDGTVIPCCLDYEAYNKLGNIFEEDLDSILQKEKSVAMKKGFEEGKLVNELCKRCGFVTRFKKGVK